MRSISVWSTVVMIIEPPGEPVARNGSPLLVTIVGAIELRGRLPPSARFGCVVESKLKSVSSLLSRNPQPGTTMPLPPVDSIVNVYDTTVPSASATVRCVVDLPLPGPAFDRRDTAPAPQLSRGLPGCTTALAARSGS